jgi:hypothetical protein
MEIQLFREGWGDDKKRERCVDLYVGAGGSVRLSSYDLGLSLKERSDDADYEYHVNVGRPSVCIASREISGPKGRRTRIS